MSVKEIGCCGAYCRTCRIYRTHCKGCKIGYDVGERDVAKARCGIRVCCLQRRLATCADCSRYSTCGILGSFHGKTGYKYGKYGQALDYVRDNRYEAFLEVADHWTNAYGKYPSPAEPTERRRTGSGA
jgi:hypothetical protein